jgi:hypothetical protein
MPVYRLAVKLTGSLAIGLLVACGSGGNEDPGLSSRTPSAISPQSTGTAGVCAAPIPAVTSARVTPARLGGDVAKMNEVQHAADSGDEAAARAAFAGDTHDITHDIDMPIRAVDPELARYLCESMASLEQQFAGKPDLQAVGAEAGIAAQLLQESGRALDLID